MTKAAKSNIYLIAEDPVMKNRIRIYAHRLGYEIRTVNKLSEGIISDLFIIEASVLGAALEEIGPEYGLKFITFGNRETVKAAFLSGCMDYLKEPWDFEEFEIRLLRAISLMDRNSRSAGFRIVPDEISAGRHKETLTREEYAIFRSLYANSGEPVPREALLFSIWGNSGSNSRTVDMHISHLRKKIKALELRAETDLPKIKTVRNFGYMII